MFLCISKVYRALLVSLLFIGLNATAVEVEKLIITPNSGGHPEWAAAIASAKSEVNLAMYNMSSQDVLEALKEAAQRKVSVNVLFDLNNSKKTRQSQMLSDLRAAGVNVTVSSPLFTISHQKTLTIDGERALISTINLTGYPGSTRGYGVIVTDRGIVDEVNRVFAQDLQNAKDGTGITPTLSEPALLWSPNHGVQKLLDLIYSAKKSIRIEVENLSYKPLIEALAEAQEVRNVKVQIITPLCGFGDNPFFNIPALQGLKTKGVAVRVMEAPSTFDKPFIHAKMLTVDGKRTYLGSLNFSYNSLLSARELGIIVDHVQTIHKIMTEFGKDWKNAIPVPDDTSKVTCPK